MANTTLQNCQRIIILIQLLIIVTVSIFQTIRIIKKKIDLNSRPLNEEPASESAADKYKQSEITQHQFDKAAVKSTTLAETDTCTERLMKKICEFSINFNPLHLSMPLNLVLGRSMPFLISIYFISLVACFLFNVFKVHRSCIQLKFGRLFFQILWSISSVLLILNIWTITPSSMLYMLKN